MQVTRPPSADPQKPPGARIILATQSRPRRALVLALVAVLLVLGHGYGAALAYAGTDVPRGTRVLGVDIGGLSEGSAVKRLNGSLGPRAAEPLRFRVQGEDVAFKPAEAGLWVDTEATVESAMEGRFGLGSVISGVLGSRDVAPRIRLDESRLEAVLGKVNKQIGSPAREGMVRFRGTTAEAVLPQEGAGLNAEMSAAPVRAAFLASLKGGREPAELETGSVRPLADADEIRRIAAGPARVAVSGPIALVAGDERISVQPQVFAPHLTFVPDKTGKVQPRVDGPKLARALASPLRKVERPARDATFKIQSGKPKVVPSKDGQEVNAKALGGAVAGTVLKTQERAVKLPMTREKPRVSTAQAGKLGIREKISTFTTEHGCCEPRVTNIHTIADILDGYIVRPGETFSLNKVVGERDKARGFVPAPMILEGRYVDSVGGGISQFTTTMFNAVFFGGLEDVQHMPHSYYISRYPAGRESTVSFPQPDFRWRNDSPHGVLVQTAYTDTSITVSFWGTKRYDIESKSSKPYAIKKFEKKKDSGDECVPMSGARGFKIDVWRIFKQNGEIVRRQKFQTTYDAQPRLTCE